MTKKLKPIIGTIKKEYPEDSELWVEFYTDVPMKLASIVDTNQEDLATKLISSMVCDWNFADREGKELEISEDNVGVLPAKIAKWIVEESTKLLRDDDVKKKE